MRIEQLECLVEVYSTKSITSAASNLHIAQQGVSKTLANLEAELGCILFVRSKKGVQFTEIGEQIVIDAKEILEKVEKMKNHALPAKRHAKRNITGTINLITTAGLFTSFIPKCLASFNSDYPKVCINSLEAPADIIFSEVANHNYDLGLVSIDENNDYMNQDICSNICFIPLRKDKPCIVVNKNSDLAKNKTISIKKLKNERLALLKTGALNDQPLYKQLLEKQNMFDICYYDDSLAMHYEIIYNNCIGVTTKIALAHTLVSNNEELVAIPIRDGITTSVGYCYAKDYPPSDLIELLIERVNYLL